jgi:hypothetical protein
MDLAPEEETLIQTHTHHTATLPSHLAKHTMGHNLLLALSYHVRSGLKRVGPTIATAPRSTLHVAAIQPRFPHLGGALPALPPAFFSPASRIVGTAISVRE